MIPLAWLAVFGGGFLVWSALNNRNPVEQFRLALTTGSAAGARPITFSGVGVGGGVGSGPDIGTVGPTTEATLVSIGYGSHRLAPNAAAAYKAATIKYGKPIPVTDSFRTRAQQEECYRNKPDLCAPPGKSDHERGLAIDVDSSKLNLDDPALVSALESTGWVRNGKRIRTGNGGYRPEPWHWAFKGQA